VKILMVAPTPFFSNRGCHVRILEETHALQRLGHDVEIVSYPLGSTPAEVRVHRTVKVPWYKKTSAGPSWHKPYLDALLAAVLYRRARRLRPDVIHAHLHEGIAVAAPVARLLKTPLIADIQGSFTDELWSHGFPRRPAALRALLLWFERMLLRLPNTVVASSDEMARQLHDDFGGQTALVAPDGVDTDVFTPDAQPADIDLPRGARVVAFLGLLTAYQGVDHLLRCIPLVRREHPDAHFLVMGFPNVERYRSLAAEVGVAEHTTFTGEVPYELAPRFLACAEIAVSPKVSKTESNGKLLNYMAMGLPTVAFDTEINRDLLGPEGTYAPYDDVPGLADAISWLLRDSAEASRRGKALRGRAVEKFSWRQTAAVLTDAYRRAADASPDAAG